MAVYRDSPYSAFNFQVNVIGGAYGPGDFRAGFQEISGLGMEIHVAEYRNGNYQDNGPQKITGSKKINDFTLKRGLCGDLGMLYNWFNPVSQGDQTQKRTVIIQVMDETRTTAVQTCTLGNVRPIKLTGPALSGKSTDVAIEELVCIAETMEWS
jgi:phage tail-like protein